MLVSLPYVPWDSDIFEQTYPDWWAILKQLSVGKWPGCDCRRALPTQSSKGLSLCLQNKSYNIISFHYLILNIINLLLSIQHGKTKLSATAFPSKAEYCSTAKMAYPLDHIVECNNQIMVAAGGNSALRLQLSVIIFSNEYYKLSPPHIHPLGPIKATLRFCSGNQDMQGHQFRKPNGAIQL